jgi:hypothetical protein
MLSYINIAVRKVFIDRVKTPLVDSLVHFQSDTHEVFSALMAFNWTWKTNFVVIETVVNQIVVLDACLNWLILNNHCCEWIRFILAALNTLNFGFRKSVKNALWYHLSRWNTLFWSLAVLLDEFQSKSLATIYTGYGSIYVFPLWTLALGITKLASFQTCNVIGFDLILYHAWFALIQIIHFQISRTILYKVICWETSDSNCIWCYFNVDFIETRLALIALINSRN